MKNSTVLLFSGGMDSYIMSQLKHYDHLLYFDIGLSDNALELQAIDELGMLDQIKTNHDLNLAPYELSNKIIPMRNLYYIMMAANLGNIIHLGATAGDTTHDKDQRFVTNANILLNYIFDKPEKAPQAIVDGNMYFNIQIPYRNSTKTQMVYQYLKAGNDPDNLYISRSCYNTNEPTECGMCRSCFRKFVALFLNDIWKERSFLDNPARYFEQNIEYARKHGRKYELDEFEKAQTIWRIK